MKSLDIIAGARPNFMKIASIIEAIHAHNASSENPIEYRLIHTGQHYDKTMSEQFFDQLNIPKPHINLGAGSGSQANQTAQIMIGYENALQEWKPDLCIVVGDVTSTMACAIVAKKAWIQVAHVEGGIRSGDMTMPEEINRIVTDSISDYFFTTTRSAGENLQLQGIAPGRIYFVGNTMIDTLLAHQDRLRKPDFYDGQGLDKNAYLVMTLHRPSNVDQADTLDKLLTVINENTGKARVIFPMHPRTKKVFDSIGKVYTNVYVTGPMDYLAFIYLVKNAMGVVTDSGGITEETTILGVPCMTLRDSTERPETVTVGTNEMVGTDEGLIAASLRKMVSRNWKTGSNPELWDGHAGSRIIDVISKL
ncbi:MAG: UDP-N-acetylglucosamine 2-epimerase (non-hydrolyzing) [Saprospiraceae bacterium]|nr:UDP-N-acetylglucosamine 2-epimerase (non-hydrolyzing) [Saprospiraceae bacterium]